jgi:hypothetical protein
MRQPGTLQLAMGQRAQSAIEFFPDRDAGLAGLTLSKLARMAWSARDNP